MMWYFIKKPLKIHKKYPKNQLETYLKSKLNKIYKFDENKIVNKNIYTKNITNNLCLPIIIDNIKFNLCIDSHEMRVYPETSIKLDDFL